MAIDSSVIGTELPPVELTVDAGRLRFFAKAIGETDPVYSDVDTAKAAGHPDLPVLPTFLFGIELEQPDPFAWLAGLGVDLRRILHGEQSFTYHAHAHAGDTLIAKPYIADVYSKKRGALEFIVKQTAVSQADGTAVADLASVIVVRNPEVAQ
ncbi:MaoC family dehydratase N-terminal domain-containing protein [Candidatus Protofrankia californiensis]|uniref:MaoC family dehydratase N-terminal domain-containing protein n=1 Tax=Candidatus Protofrankia californiensis TaxID=1839754 RepID=UPI0010410913|nr:MaoC family dehydratase N-terminal domain-containing protein [Candidatus Protofrankia californiensis]